MNIRGPLTSYERGGNGATSSPAPVTRPNYGGGGDGNTGLGFQGILILRFSAFSITDIENVQTCKKKLNINVGNGLTLNSRNNLISTIWTINNNDMYNITILTMLDSKRTSLCLEELHIGGGGTLLLIDDCDH